MILKINVRGDLLALGEIVSGLFIACGGNYARSHNLSVVLPINYCGCVAGIDLDGNIFIRASGGVDYYYGGYRDGKLETIGGARLDYYYGGYRDGKLETIGGAKVDYYYGGYRDGKLETIGGTKID